MTPDQARALPFVVVTHFRPFACPPATWDQMAPSYPVSSGIDAVGLTDPDGTAVTEGSPVYVAFRDTCPAVFTANGVGVANNNGPLQALSDRIALDYWSWRLVAFDGVFNGVIAPAPDGYTDEIEWRYDADHCETRRRSAAWDDTVEQYNHSDPPDTCDGRLGVYLDSPAAAVAGGNLTLNRGKVWVEDGLLRWIPDGVDTLTICPPLPPG